MVKIWKPDREKDQIPFNRVLLKAWILKAVGEGSKGLRTILANSYITLERLETPERDLMELWT